MINKGFKTKGGLIFIKILQVSVYLNRIIKVYNNVKEASLVVYGSSDYILQACKGKHNHYAYGYLWYFNKI